MDTDHPGNHFQNTGTYLRHREFLDAIGFDQSQSTAMGHLQYDPDLAAPDGSPRVFYYSLSPDSYPFTLAVRTHLMLTYGVVYSVDDSMA